MISIIKIIDKKNEDKDVLLFPKIEFYTKKESARELKTSVDLRSITIGEENLCNDGDSTIILGYWKDSKHKKDREKDFVARYRIENTTKSTQIFWQKRIHHRYSMLVVWDALNRFDTDHRSDDPDFCYGAIKLAGDFRLCFEDKSRSTLAFQKSLRGKFHVNPKKKLKIMSMCFPDQALNSKEIEEK